MSASGLEQWTTGKQGATRGSARARTRVTVVPGQCQERRATWQWPEVLLPPRYGASPIDAMGTGNARRKPQSEIMALPSASLWPQPTSITVAIHSVPRRQVPIYRRNQRDLPRHLAHAGTGMVRRRYGWSSCLGSAPGYRGDVEHAGVSHSFLMISEKMRLKTADTTFGRFG